MDNNEILKIAVLLALAAFLLYRKYGKNKTWQNKSSGFLKGPKSTSSAEKDDYEPYSGSGSDKLSDK